MQDLLKRIVNDQVRSLIRVGLNALGGYLVANQLAEADELSALTELGELLTAAAPNIIAIVWTIIENRISKQKIVTAAETGVVT